MPIINATDLPTGSLKGVLRAGPGDIIIVPPGAPHKFTNDGPDGSHLVCIHASPTFVTEWLE